MVRKSSKTKNRRLELGGLRMLLPAERFFYEMCFTNSVKPQNVKLNITKPPLDFENIIDNRDLA